MKVSYFRNAITAFIVGSFVGAIVMLFNRSYPAENSDLLTYMLGQLSGFAGATIAFYFSTTLGGEHKSELLAQREAQPSGQAGDPVHVTEEQ